MIRPHQQDQSFLEDVQDAQGEPPALHIWWLGQSGFLLQWKRRHVLLDPYLSDSLTLKYAATDKPHVRMTERVVAPGRLDFVDLMTSSHNHTDHLDAATLIPLLQANPRATLVVPEANREFAAQRLQVPVERLEAIDADQQRGFDHDIRLHAVPAAHEQLERDDQGRYCYLGYVLQWGPWTIYHSGDTVRYPGQAERLQKFSIDVALLPINGSLPERGVAGNLWGREAAQLAHDIQAGCVIPCHFEMFEFNTVTPDEFVQTSEALGQPYRVLRNGERHRVTEPASP